MSPLPTQLRDRWRDRVEPPAGRGTLYWHVLMHDHPEAIAAAADAQRLLAPFTGLHLPPPEWLHMTIQVVGSTEEITREQMQQLLVCANHRLRELKPVTAVIGRVLYHPEAIMLSVEPREALLPIREAIGLATTEVIGQDASTQQDQSEWIPHMTVSYSTSDQDAQPIVAALGRAVSQRRILVDQVSLVVQWGPERRWDWEPVDTAVLGSR